MNLLPIQRFFVYMVVSICMLGHTPSGSRQALGKQATIAARSQGNSDTAQQVQQGINSSPKTKLKFYKLGSFKAAKENQPIDGYIKSQRGWVQFWDRLQKSELMPKVDFSRGWAELATTGG